MKKRGIEQDKQCGFSLIELMVVVAIITILAAIAYPSYTQYLIRANRSAAQAEMLDIANRQQQFLLTNRCYVNKTTLEATGYALPADISSKYDYDIVVPDPCSAGGVPFYTLTFTATGNQLSDGNLTINSNGQKTPVDKWK